jgi:hypothetical protein
MMTLAERTRLDELAPSPPDVEACSCDEALALRRELARAQRLIEAMELGGRALEGRVAALSFEPHRHRLCAVREAWAAGGGDGLD